MYYTLLMPSLEHFALIKTAITLWNPDDTCHLTTSSFYFSQMQWEVIENCIIEKGKELPLPESLKKKVLGFIRPIGIEIREFVNRYLYYLSDGIKDRAKSIARKSLKKLCWSPHGIIDEKKTAAELIKDENLSITTRYKLACIYCFEDYILMLWNKMPKDCKKSFYNEKDPGLIKQHKLVVFWTYDIKGEVTRLDNIFMQGRTPYKYAFDNAASSGNKAAIEHFFQKLTYEEREEYLENPCYFNKGTLFYFLSQMNEVQQIKLLTADSWVTLIHLLDWPLQGLFVEIAKHFTFGPSTGYILKAFFNKVNNGFKDYNYQKLFTEFWQIIPITDKNRYLLNLCLSNLLDMKEKENFKLIVEDEAMYSENFIFSGAGKHFCKKLIYDDEMDLLEFFVQKYILSKDQMIKFREELERHIKNYCSEEVRQEKKDLLNKAFQLLNDLTKKFDKRCVEEGNDGPVKRICSLTNELNSQKEKSSNSSDDDTPKKAEEEEEDVPDELNSQKKKSSNKSDDDTPKKAEEEKEDVPDVNPVAGPSWRISEPVADSTPRVIESRKRRRESGNTTEDQIILQQEKMLQTLTNIEENSRIQVQELKELNKNITLLNDNFIKAVQLLTNANNVPTNE